MNTLNDNAVLTFMKQEKIGPLVPPQETGARSDTSHSVRFESREQAIDFFNNVAIPRLLNVSKWHELCGLVTATFDLTDSKGEKVDRPVMEGDFFRIDIPGPGPKTGQGYDWVKVASIKRESDDAMDFESLSIQVFPSNPIEKDQETAHFFKGDATSTFSVSREKTFIRAEIHGRNEKPNLKPGNTLDSFRNAITSLAAMLGFARVQWKQLAKGLISTTADEGKIN